MRNSNTPHRVARSRPLVLRATLRPGGGRTTGSTDDAKHVFVLHDWPLNPTLGECVHSTACLGVAARCGACSTATFSERGLDCRNLLLVLPPSRVGAGSVLCSILNDSHVFYAARSLGETCAHCTYRRRQTGKAAARGARPRKGAPHWQVASGAHNLKEHCQRNANKHGKCVLKA